MRASFGKGDVVVEAAVNGRSVDQSCAREKSLDGLRHDVRAGVTDQLEPILIDLTLSGLGGDQGEFAVLRDLPRQIDELVSDACAQRGFGQAWADVRGHLACGGGCVVVSNTAVWKLDLEHHRSVRDDARSFRGKQLALALDRGW